MTQQSTQLQPTMISSVPWRGVAIVLVILAFGIAPFWPGIVRAAHQSAGLHAPEWAQWLAAPLKVQIHSAAALTALGIGIVIMMRPKGRALHRNLGWAWVAAMAVTAVSSFFLGVDSFYSLLHLLAGWTIIALPIGLWGIRQGKVQIHRRMMTGMFVGGLLVAGVLNFLPGRLFWSMFFG